MLLLPATTFHLLLVARSGPARLLGPPPYLPGLEALWSPRALLLWLTWLGLQAALYLLPARKVWPGLADTRGRRAEGRAARRAPSTLIRDPLFLQVAEGQELKDRSRLRYPINGAWGHGRCVYGDGAAGLVGRLCRSAPDPNLRYVSLFCPGQTRGISVSSMPLVTPSLLKTAFAATLCTRSVVG